MSDKHLPSALRMGRKIFIKLYIFLLACMHRQDEEIERKAKKEQEKLKKGNLIK